MLTRVPGLAPDADEPSASVGLKRNQASLAMGLESERHLNSDEDEKSAHTQTFCRCHSSERKCKSESDMIISEGGR